jgi:hypothetical protein
MTIASMMPGESNRIIFWADAIGPRGSSAPSAQPPSVDTATKATLMPVKLTRVLTRAPGKRFGCYNLFGTYKKETTRSGILCAQPGLRHCKILLSPVSPKVPATSGRIRPRGIVSSVSPTTCARPTRPELVSGQGWRLPAGDVSFITAAA